MIQDSETNILYLADCLPSKHPAFFLRFEKTLKDCKVSFELIPDTADIWAVDYMPVQISKGKFIKFKYYPDYLIEYPETISDVDSICDNMRLSFTKSDLIVDGGNIVRAKNKVIMCDKIFHENKKYHEKDLIKKLIELLQIDKLIFVPWDLKDFTGHADGMVRFIDDDTVLVNQYINEDMEYQKSFRMALHNAGLDWVELPYNPPFDPTYTSARGLYLNYLQMKQAVVMPIFKSKLDDRAYKILEKVFSEQIIETVESNELAKEGGVLNCITYNIAV